jgi:hypothetical protein
LSFLFFCCGRQDYRERSLGRSGFDGERGREREGKEGRGKQAWVRGKL